MHRTIPIDRDRARKAVSTGDLPDVETIRQVLEQAYLEFRNLRDGKVADYIPVLARASPDLFGISMANVRGQIHNRGDTAREFSIQSVSKPFVFALVCEAIGEEEAREKLGVNNTGLPFNSVMAVELNANRTMNPMVNAGAIATTSLLPGGNSEAKWECLLDGLSRFAGRPLHVDEEVYKCESATNQRNRGIAKLLEGYGRMYCDGLEATDLYTRQCALAVTSADLAVMGATLADGGVNPVTGNRVISGEHCKHVLAVLAASGLYELSGDWLYDVGLPGKSGVSGGMITIAPGKGALGIFSPRLDEAGNSVRGQCASRFLSEHLGLNLFASRPNPATPAAKVD
jgi:glutaminase